MRQTLPIFKLESARICGRNNAPPRIAKTPNGWSGSEIRLATAAISSSHSETRAAENLPELSPVDDKSTFVTENLGREAGRLNVRHIVSLDSSPQQTEEAQ